MDWISSLPDEVLCHILSFLPTKHAVATSVLSSRWVKLWTFVPIIDLDDSIYLNPSRKGQSSLLFVRFFERVSSLNESKTILKFRLHMHYHTKYIRTLSEINRLIQNVFLRNVIEFDLEIFSYLYDDEYYLKIPHSESLKVLKVRIDSVYSLKIPAFSGCFPSLCVFDAKLSLYDDDELIKDLFPCLPAALEKLCLDLKLREDMVQFTLNIGGAALKHLELQLCICLYDEPDYVVVIDAPKLDYLRLHGTFLPSYVVEHKPAISEVRLHVEQDHYHFDDLDGVDPPRVARFNELLQGLVNAKFISVSASTIKDIFSQDWNIPLLPSLTKLELEVPSSQRGWIWLLHWLESCPNLNVLSLFIKEDDDWVPEENDEVVPDVVPSCLSSCVKEIKIKRIEKVDHEKMLIYLLYNAKVLDEFTVDSRVYIKDGIVQ